MLSATRWLAAASRGYCGETSDREQGDCAIGDQGNLGLPRRASLSWATAANECLRRCSECSRCNFISLSISFKDCSWYHQCPSLKHKVSGFRSGLARNHSIVLLTRRQRRALRNVTRKKRAALRLRTGEGEPIQWPWFAPYPSVRVALLLCGKIGTLADPSSWIPPDQVRPDLLIWPARARRIELAHL